jgi:DNA-binding NarL/FixJ family response regulator
MDHAHNKKVYQYDNKGNLVKVYNSVKEASQQSGVSDCLISSIVHKNRLTGGGYIWRNKQTTFTKEELDKIYNPPTSRELEIIQMTKEGVEINRYPTIVKAAQNTQIDPSSLTKACKGIRKTCGGYKWKYVEDNCSKRLTKTEQLEIMQKHKDGMLVKDIANIYKKSVDTIRRVIKLSNMH